MADGEGDDVFYEGDDDDFEEDEEPFIDGPFESSMCPDVDDVFPERPVKRQHRFQEEIDIDFSSFRIPPSQFKDPLESSGGAGIDFQVTDIECQNKLRVDEMDDQNVLEYLHSAHHSEQSRSEPQFQIAGEHRRPRSEFRAFWQVPCMRMYGRLRDGRSTCFNVFGYYPIVHLLLVNVELTQSILDEMVITIEDILTDIDTKKRFGKTRPQGFKYIIGANLRKGFPMYPYVGDPLMFIELKLALLEFIRMFSETFTDYPEVTVNCIGSRVTVRPYSCINIVEQFQADKGISGYGWVRVNAKRIMTVDSQTEPDSAWVNLEFNTNVDDLSVLKHDDSIAPQRAITYDIECAKKIGIPTPDKNEVILIACILGEYIDGQPVRKRRVLLQLGSSNPVEGIKPENGDMHIHFTEEQALLNAFGYLKRAFDPDFIIGHNLINFDLPYIVERSHKLSCSEFSQFMGRRSAYKWYAPRRTKKKRKNGETTETTMIDTPGVIQLDTLTWIRAVCKLRSYKLESLAQEFLNSHKLEMSVNMITPMWKGTDETRKRLADYNLRDSILTDGLVDHKRFTMILTTVEMSRQTRVPAPKLLRSGQQARVWGVLLEKTKSPHWDADNTPVFVPYERPKQRGKDDKFAGAVVLEPSRGFYTRPVICGDFRSLYPSIIIYLNICYSTVITDPKYLSLPHMTSPSGTHFVDKSVRVGLLAQIEEELMAQRDYAKKQAKEAVDPSQKEKYNSRQNEIKIVCNSVYGILSASGGRLVRIELGLAVTSQGRKMIMIAKQIAESPPFNCTVIYGDTDSIFILVPEGVTDMIEAFKLLIEICDAATLAFAPSPVMLQAEKAMGRLVLVNKKRYIAEKLLAIGGSVVRDPVTNKVLSVKLGKGERINMGVEIARRDNCLLVKDKMEQIVDAIVLENNIPKARGVVDGVLRDLLSGNVDIGKLIITKAITKDDYKQDPMHLIVAKRMRGRDPSYEMGPGERVPFVIVKVPHKTIAEQAEDPLWAVNHDKKIDEKYYIDHQLAGPISRIFMWLMINDIEKRTIAHIEDQIRATKTDEEALLVKKKLLDPQLGKIQDRVKKILFGANALAAHPIKEQVSHLHGIGAFMRPVQRCIRCEAANATPGFKLCKSCQPDTCACFTPGCKHKPSCPMEKDAPDKYCLYCMDRMGTCDICQRHPIIIETDGLCASCLADTCYACGEPAISDKKGLCEKCFHFMEVRRGSSSSAPSNNKGPDDIEDLLKKIDGIKHECFEKCGLSSDEIKCVSKECETLYRRAVLEAKIRNLKK